MELTRIQDWMDGKILDIELSPDEITWLEVAVMAAIEHKLFHRGDLIVFTDHETLQ